MFLTARPKPSGARCNRVTWQIKQRACKDLISYLTLPSKKELELFVEETQYLYQRIEKILQKYRAKGIL